MKWSYVITLYIAAAFIFGCFIFSLVKTRKQPIEKPVRRLLFFAATAITSYATAIFLPSRLASSFVFGFYNCFIDAMVFSLMIYIRHYTGCAPRIKQENLIISAAMLLDCIFMLTNPFTKKVYLVALSEDALGSEYYHIADRGPLCVYHLAFVYLIMFHLMSILIRRYLSSPKIYKVKYVALLTSLCIVLVLHATYLNFSFDFDYSLFFYVIIAFSVFYFSLIYVPRGLMERLLLFSVANMQNGIICVDIDGKCVNANQPARSYCWNGEGLSDIDKQIQEWFAENPDMASKDMQWDTTRRIDGKIRYFSNEYKRIFDEDRRYLGCFFILHDRTDEQNRLAEEKYRATHDSLTGIFNKDNFYAEAEKMLRSNPNKQFCIVYIDIKNFKLVNDLFGVEMGDTVLKRVATSIAKLATQYSVYGRLTGDRFAVLMLRERLNEKLLLSESAKLSGIINNAVFKLHAHFGIYFITDPTLKISIMCDRANLAIRTIKSSYQNTVAYYDRTIRDNFIEEQKLINEFENALNTGQFHAYIQPQIFADGKVLGGEALVRWIHPTDGMIPPYKFIDILERTGLIGRLDSHMWELACIQLKKWYDDGLTDNYISVNISQKDFYLIDVYSTLTSLVNKYGLRPRSLHLEITETAIMNNPEEQLQLIEKLRAFGFIVEIDDFGSGYSSLNTLKDLQADVLKVDMGFLGRTENHERSKLILSMIISMAKALNMEVITEGVETREQVEFLTKFGCDVFQGYYFAKPMPISEFENKFLNALIYL